MTVVLNDLAIEALFDAPEGGIARFVEGEAQKVGVKIQGNIREYFKTAETGVEDDVFYRMDGSTAIVWIEDDPSARSRSTETKVSRLSRLGYLDRWFTEALQP